MSKLIGRFEHRVTTVTGAAGAGKSTALAAAVASNRLDPAGRDVWVAVPTSGITGVQLTGAIASALDVPGTSDVADTIERIADALWSSAPDDIAIVIDDAHLADGDGAVDAIRRLVDVLPTNGHVVLGTRSRIDVPVARLRATGLLLEVSERDLELDDDELAALEARVGVNAEGATGSQMPRHVATADLQLAAGIEAGADFLWEEVLVRLDADRLRHLRHCAVLEQLDDELVGAITDGDHDAGSLLDGLPLVETLPNGRRMHAILREALAHRLEPGERRKILSVAADAERARDRLAVAVQLHDLAGDPVSALDAAREFSMTRMVTQTMDDVVIVRRIANRIRPDAAVTRFLDAMTHFDGLEAHVAQLLIAAADAARASGDVRLETMALYRTGQFQMFHHDPAVTETSRRIQTLGRDDEFAAAVYAYFESIWHQIAGRSDESLRMLDQIGPLGRETELTVRAERLYDLGRPEQVALGLTAQDYATLPPGAAAFIGISIWARGDSSPEISLAAVTESVARATRARYTHPLVHNLGTGVQIALTAGADDIARRWSSQATEAVSGGAGPAVADVELVARAALAASVDSDEAAIEMLRREQPRLQHPEANAWPSRATLTSLPLVYLARPDLRPMLDACSFGPAISSIVDAARCLVAIRDEGDPSGAAAIPWGRVGLLRAHLLPHHLIELVCAAIAVDRDDARAILDLVPHTDRGLRRACDSPSDAVASVARELLGATPTPEPFELHAVLLGGVRLLRDGVEVHSPEFAKRHKVRELFGLLHERGRLQRHEICAALWPDHDDEERALASLRTTLSTLNGVLEPDRERGRSAFHLIVDGDTVQLDGRVTADIDLFERTIDDAQAHDAAGLPARALEAYRRAAEVYCGDYLHGIDAPWLVLTRLRLRALAVSAVCRVAELTAARGEPEEAARWAASGRSIDPLSERAGRLFVSSLEAMGDRSAAREAAVELAAMLSDAELSPEPATARLLDRLH
ncbi:MAG: BTAD domain-containing putative transcriptional regulator [Ilumatobacter sp.]